jgi:oligopeptide/dipeptide ABC transporter ATP-binding protein
MSTMLGRPAQPYRQARASVGGPPEPYLVISGLGLTLQRNGQAVPILDDLSLHVEQGEVLGVVGESGSGKTMTALSVLRLLPRGARLTGSVRLDGQELLDLTEAEMRQVRGARVGMIFQEPVAALNPVFTVGAQLMAAIRAHQELTRSDARARAVELLRTVGLPDPERRLRQYPHELSGGMCQRVMIAMAIASGARLLIADEPTTALDVTIQDEIVRLIRRLAVESQIAVLFISHDLGLVARLCHRVVVMYAGQIVESGPASELLRSPLHPYTQALLRCVPDLHAVGVVRRGIPGSPPLPGTIPAGCRFRPRCEFAAEACAAPQQLRSTSPDHQVRCVRAEWLAGSRAGGT